MEFVKICKSSNNSAIPSDGMTIFCHFEFCWNTLSSNILASKSKVTYISSYKTNFLDE